MKGKKAKKGKKSDLFLSGQKKEKKRHERHGTSHGGTGMEVPYVKVEVLLGGK